MSWSAPQIVSSDLFQQDVSEHLQGLTTTVRQEALQVSTTTVHQLLIMTGPRIHKGEDEQLNN